MYFGRYHVSFGDSEMIKPDRVLVGLPSQVRTSNCFSWCGFIILFRSLLTCYPVSLSLTRQHPSFWHESLVWLFLFRKFNFRMWSDYDYYCYYCDQQAAPFGASLTGCKIILDRRFFSGDRTSNSSLVGHGYFLRWVMSLISKPPKNLESKQLTTQLRMSQA